MKQILLIAGLLLIASRGLSQSSTADGIVYSVSNNVVTITDYLGSGSVVNIPSSIAGFPVKAIGAGAFLNKASVSSVNIPTSVTSIGLRAFQNCSALTNISIPSGVSIIPGSAFSGCTALAQVALPGGLTAIEMSAFSGCSSLEEVSLPSSLATIGTNAFGFCAKLVAVAIPSSVKSIEDYAFHKCINLDTIIFQGGPPTTIGNWVFQDTKVAKLYYFTGALGWGATYAGIVVQALQTSGSTLSGFAYELVGASYAITSYTGTDATPAVPSSINGVQVTAIGSAAFRYNVTITTVTIPASVSSFGERVFENCTGLLSIAIPSGVKTIPNGMFYNCQGLASVTLPSTTTAIGSSAFYGAKSLRTIVLPIGLLSVGAEAFRGCTALEAIAIPSSVTSLGAQAFNSCTSLTTVVLPAGLTAISDLLFYGCSSLSSVTLPNTVTSIGKSAFLRCTSLVSVTLPSSLKTIDSGAFYSCSSLGEIDIPSGVVSIGDAAFHGCSAATSLKIPASLSSIGAGAFYDNYRVRDIIVDASSPSFSTDGKVLFDKEKKNLMYTAAASLTGGYAVPGTVTTIRSSAFSKCSSLTSVVIPSSVSSIESAAFYGCTSLVSIVVDSNNISYYSDGKVIYTKDRSTLVAAPAVAGLTGAYAILDGVSNILGSAFVGCVGLTKIVIPSGVTTIGSAAFDRCSSLVSLIIPGSVTNIGTYAFNATSSLRRILFLGNRPALGSYVFNRSALTEVYYASGASEWSSTIADLPAIAMLPTSITVPPASISIVSGDRAELVVSAVGATPLSYQWYRGSSGDLTTPILGATSPQLLTPALSTTANYWVRITDVNGFLTESPTATVAVSSVSPLTVSHSLVGSGYQAGGGVIVTGTISYDGTAPSTVTWATLLPAGWKFLGSGGSEGSGLRPIYKSGDLIEWSWSNVPPSPFEFSFMLGVPSGTAGDQVLVSLVTSTQAGTTYQAMAKPDPLVIKSVSNHSADTNRDFTISLNELTRVIELYNYRSGTSRTGRYKIQSGTEDGFSPGP